MKSLQSAFLAAAVVLAITPLANAQGMPHVQGSQDAMSSASQQPVLPAGHPGAGEGPSFHNEGMQSPKTGAIRVVISQGTKDAAVLGHDPVTVQLFAKGNVLQTYNATIGDKGIVEIHDLPLDVAFQPVITVIHGGAEQQLVGPPMHKYQPAIELEMKVYELTAEKPAWTIGLRHVIAEPITVNGALTLHITEMIGGFNPADRAWTGQDGTTLTIELPAGARDVTFGPGLAEAGVQVKGNIITRGKTMLPGSAQYVFGYTLPVVNGTASISLTAPADTTLFAFYMPETVKVEHTAGIAANAASGTHALEGRQLLKAKSVKAGQVITVDLSNIALAPQPTTAPSINDLPNGIHAPTHSESKP